MSGRRFVIEAVVVLVVICAFFLGAFSLAGGR